MPIPPNKIKYSTSFHPNTIKVKDWVLGINEGVEYGPTSVTKFWNSIIPPSGGYTMYGNKAVAGPSIVVAQNDSELIGFTQGFARQTFNTANEALGWYTGQTGLICVNLDYPDIVTDGLTLLLDAGYVSSYPRSGSRWDDLSFSGNNGTLVNTPTFSSDNYGYLTFNGSNQFVNVSGTPVGITAYTKNIWFYLNRTADNNLLSSDVGGHFMYFSGTNKLYCGHSDWSNYSDYPSTADFSNGVWYNACLTFDTIDGFILYINGDEDSVYTAQKTPVSGNGSTRIGSFGLGNLLNGRVSVAMTYNRVLSSTEVLKNYNSFSSRFISPTQTPTITPTQTTTNTPTPSITSTLTPTNTSTNTPTPTLTPTNTPTNTVTPTITSTMTPTQTPGPILSNLVLYYDPSNTSSYSGTGTTINDLSGNALSGTLSNVTYTSPYLSFNGSSSQISIPDNVLLEPGSGDWTIEFWVSHSVITGSSRILIAKTNGGNSADWGYGLRTVSNGNTYLEVGNGTTSITSPSYAVFTNTWYQVVGVWTNVVSNSIELYINGVSQGSNSHSFTSIKNTTSPLYVGSFNGGQFSQWLNGSAGIVRIYNKALTGSEVLQNYNNDYTKYIPVTPTPTPTITPTSTITPTPSITPTNTQTPTPSITPTRTVTPTPSITPTNTQTPTLSITPTNTITPTPSITPTRTVTPTISITPTNTPTPTTTPIPVTGVTFSQAFTGGTAPSIAIETAWNTFRGRLTGTTYTQFVWSSTNGNTLTVSHPTLVQTLANALRTATVTAVTINSVSWNVGTGCGTPKIGGVAVEFSNIGSCNASSTYALRPMINNLNWGGTNQSTVNAPSQTITLTFS